jgi:hypothetical protein
MASATSVTNVARMMKRIGRERLPTIAAQPAQRVFFLSRSAEADRE